MKTRINSTRRRRTAVLAVVLLSAFCSAFTVSTAAAGTAASAEGYPTIGGAAYVNKAFIVTGTRVAYSVTSMRQRDGSTPVGYAGARGRLFNSGGTLVCEGVTQYNTTTAGEANGTSCTNNNAGTWYGIGATLGWNGASYNTLFTFKTPNQTS